MASILDGYDPAGFHDEMFEAPGAVRSHCAPLYEKLHSLAGSDVLRRQQAAEKALLSLGITFSVYKDGQGTDRVFPFDIIPRIIDAAEWEHVERGLKQRIQALNLFLTDLYGEGKILKDGIVPRDIVEGSRGFLKEMRGILPPRGVWCHVTGTDLIRHGDGRFYVLEDNIRVPSGVSYVLENREVMKRTFPAVFQDLGVRPVYDYPYHLLRMLQHMSPVSDPVVAVLTPGIYNSAYFEHSFLAQQMGIQLVEGRDLAVVGDRVCMRTTRGWKKVDVLYRRIDDVFIDPAVFRPDSALGVRGLMDVYRKGNLVLANAPGTGVADDKVVYAYVPKIIRYYLDEDAILPSVPTYVCQEEKDRAYVLDHLPELVVKPANEAGGYGLMIGPTASRSMLKDFAGRIAADPRNYIAQPVMALSRVPTIVGRKTEGRHVDLRPFIINGEEIYVMPGGLCRVALKRGSLVVNSSQGGGSKDTWVLGRGPA